VVVVWLLFACCACCFDVVVFVLVAAIHPLVDSDVLCGDDVVLLMVLEC